MPTALILVGGLGTKLRPSVSDRPKSLALVQGQPFLSFQIERLKRHGIRKIVLCTGYMAEMIEETFPQEETETTIIHSREVMPLGTGGALRLGLEKTGLDEDPILALNGDTFCDFDLGEFIVWHKEKKSQASILLAEVDNPDRYGTVETMQDGRVVEFREKDADQSSSVWINAGVYLFCRSIILDVDLNQKFSLEKDLFPSWLDKGIYAYKGGRRLLDIGTPESYSLAQEYDV